MTHTEYASSLLGETALIETVTAQDGTLELTGVVAAYDEGRLTVTLDDDPPGSPIGLAAISVFAPEALYRFTGNVSVTGRELVTEPDVTLERVQRRKWPRRRLDLPVTLCPVSDGLRVEGIPGRTVDVSIGGCCVETLRPVDGEGEPMVILSLPDGTTIVSGTATVAVEDLGDGWRYRLAFRHLDAHDAGRLAHLTN